MDERTHDTAEPVAMPEAKKKWLTPELVIEDIKEVTAGGTGRARNLATEDKVTTYYHS